MRYSLVERVENGMENKEPEDMRNE